VHFDSYDVSHYEIGRTDKKLDRSEVYSNEEKQFVLKVIKDVLKTEAPTVRLSQSAPTPIKKFRPSIFGTSSKRSPNKSYVTTCGRKLRQVALEKLHDTAAAKCNMNLLLFIVIYPEKPN
jgi:hypothetical protein